MYDYQKKFIEAMSTRPGKELVIVSSGRQTGKSILYNQMFKVIMENPYTKLTTSNVDGNPWYTVKCNEEVAAYIRAQSGQDNRWYEHIDQNWYIHKNTFDVCEEIYIQIGLKFNK